MTDIIPSSKRRADTRFAGDDLLRRIWPVAPNNSENPTLHDPARKASLASVLGAVGIVFGDIGTSPLYALGQVFFGAATLPTSEDHVLGAISLVVWTLTLIVSIKYALLVLRADNGGEGGVFALYGLLHRDPSRRSLRLVLWTLILGAGLLFGDGIITPAISVLSAVEGLTVVTPAFNDWIVPITLAVLTLLFVVQRHGTAMIGRVFGPVLVLWFAVIGVLGVMAIMRAPGILAALNPVLGLRFLMHIPFMDALIILGAIMLCVTGGEAMYADLGHFGKRPIQAGWFALVYPTLLLNYLGQGAYLLSGAPVAGGNLFYALVPPALIYPMVILATLATVIASQALISGAFSLVSQAIRLGLFPRIRLMHTHESHSGQIYVGVINWILFCSCMALVLVFGSSAALANAYGLSVSGVMVITSAAMIPVARRRWSWPASLSWGVWGGFTAINAMFLLASTLKFLDGGYVPVSIGLVAFAVMSTWKWGRKAVFETYARSDLMTLGQFVDLHGRNPGFMERDALLMVPAALHSPDDRVPLLAQMLWERHGALARNLIFLHVNHVDMPYVAEDRYRITYFRKDPTGGNVLQVEVRFGFMEDPDVESVLDGIAEHHEINLPADRRRWIVHASNENLLPPRLASWPQHLRFRLFQWLRLTSRPAYYYYGLGVDVPLTVEVFSVRLH